MEKKKKNLTLNESECHRLNFFFFLFLMIDNDGTYVESKPVKAIKTKWKSHDCIFMREKCNSIQAIQSEAINLRDFFVVVVVGKSLSAKANDTHDNR